MRKRKLKAFASPRAAIRAGATLTFAYPSGVSMKTVLLATAVSIAAVGLAAASCVSRPQGSPGVDAANSSETDMKPPMMFREAKLPKDFPPPGPVGEVIVKQYPPYRAAWTTAPAGSRNASNAMFRPLFNHIKKNDIPMTAPVEMTYENQSGPDAQPVAMAFLYRDTSVTPTKVDANVQVADLPAQTVLSISVRGGYEKSYEKGISQLREWLAANPGRYEVAGPPRFLGYNSPMVPPFLRVGEVQIPVRPATAAAQAH